MSNVRIIVFAKAPVPGTVKTRLAVRFGAAGAAALHRELVEHTMATACGFGEGAVELCCAPDASDAFFIECAARHAVQLTEQGDGDLGARMHRALDRAIAAGDAALLIGTDCPALASDHLAAAATMLDRGARVVLGPAEDGGYVLVGARDAVVPTMFEDVAWGTDTVLSTTRSRLHAAGVAWEELPLLWDVDHPADVERWHALRATDAR